MKLKPYKDIKVNVLRSTENPLEVLQTAINITMKKDFKKPKKNLKKTIEFLVKANHTAPLEFIDYTFLIEGASRNFLTQITRHRMASFMSGSQHYQTYSDYSLRVDEELLEHKEVEWAADESMEIYQQLMEKGVPKYEARQILPGGMENNLLVKMNARSLANFFNLRLCERNVNEMKIVTNKMYDCVSNHLPELWNNIGPDCYMTNCRQGKMKCSTGYTHGNKKTSNNSN